MTVHAQLRTEDAARHGTGGNSFRPAPDHTAAALRRQSRPWLAAAALASFVFITHAPFLAGSLEDIDSVNFSLAIDYFDVADHRPHPPGYPILTALGKLAAAAASPLTSATDAEPFVGHAAVLAFWGVLLGALAVFPLVQLFRSLEDENRTVLAATFLTVVCPLLWLSMVRPMSDIPGLTAALLAQALLATGFVRQQQDRTQDGATAVAEAESGRMLVLGALVAGLAIGLRVQTAWLTLPLLMVALLDRTGRGAAGALLGCSMTFTIGVLSWAIPLIVASGGIGGYLDALAVQAGEDFAGVEMLATDPSVRGLAFALVHTFVMPWSSIPLAVAVLAPAIIGLAAMGLEARRSLVLLAAAFAPYAIFHLLFHETLTVRYALPLIPPVAYLAVRGLEMLSQRAAPIVILAIGLLILALTMPDVMAYSRAGSPLHRASRNMSELSARLDTRPTITMHHAFSRALRGEALPGHVLAGPPRYEWLQLTNHWLAGNTDRVWFLADPRRTDLALIDPASRRLVRSYGWTLRAPSLLSGTRPADLEWYEIESPGWFVTEGWALTPETAGVARQAGAGPAERPISAFIRRRFEPMTLMIGGRNLGGRSDPDVRFEVSLDATVLKSWDVSPDPGFFLHMWTVPAGSLSGPGPFARLEITAEASDGSRRPVGAAIEQFDAQPAGTFVFGFDDGWHEHEHNPATGRSWRWTSDRATLRIRPSGRDVTLRIAGESPLRYFDSAPAVFVRVEGEILARFAPDADFNVIVRIPAPLLERAGGLVTVETDRVFVPAERAGLADRRRLGLRVYEVTVH